MAAAGVGNPVPPLPEWMLVANAMRSLHLSERQVLEDCSPGMLYRIGILNEIEEEIAEDERRRQELENRMGGRH